MSWCTTRDGGSRCIAAVVVLAAVGRLSAAPLPEAEQRVVAIGDVHGAHEELSSLLRETGLVDDELHWVGGETYLVQTGDLLDRGADVAAVLDLLMRLQSEAQRSGGGVVVLLGNHEVMNLVHVYRDVGDAMWGRFATADSQRLREEAYDRWRAWRRARPELTAPEGGPQGGGAGWEAAPPGPSREEWMAAHPAGFFEFQAALGPAGRYGRWLRQRPLVARVGSTGFLHAGLGPGWLSTGIDGLNADVGAALATFDGVVSRLSEAGVILPFFTLAEIQDAAVAAADAGDPTAAEEVRNLQAIEWLLAPEGPFWYRGWAKLADEELSPIVEAAAASLGVERLVAGHSPRSDGIEVRLGGRLYLIDTGMLTSHYHGRPAALELRGAEATAYYLGGERHRLEPDRLAVPASRDAERRTARREWAQVRLAAGREGLHYEVPQRLWRDAEGAELPFSTTDEALEFLRLATAVSSSATPQGVSKPRKLLLERNGVRAHAVFHAVDDRRERVRMADGQMAMFFLDSWRGQVAAWETARLLGVDAVPPTVERELWGQTGSLQLWIEGALTEKDRHARKISPPELSYFRQQHRDMRVFHNLINNADPNEGNILYDSEWNLWMIDHSRSFARDTRLPRPADVTHCSRRLWQALQTLDETALAETLSPYLTTFEVKALWQRRERLLDLLARRIQSQGEEKVLFDYGDAESGVEIHYDNASGGGSAEDVTAVAR